MPCVRIYREIILYSVLLWQFRHILLVIASTIYFDICHNKDHTIFSSNNSINKHPYCSEDNIIYKNQPSKTHKPDITDQLINDQSYFAYDAHIIDSEYIIIYNDYHSTNKRKELLYEISLSCDLTRDKTIWNIIARKQNNPFAYKYPSDFDIIALNLTNISSGFIERQIACFNQDPRVKKIIPHFRVTRKLLHSPNDINTEIFYYQNEFKGRRKRMSLPYSFNSNDRYTDKKDFKSWFSPSTNKNKMRRPLQMNSQFEQKISHLLGADILWSLNVTGRGVRVGVFDTGLSSPHHPHFRRIAGVTDWTYESLTSSPTFDNRDEFVNSGPEIVGAVSRRHAAGVDTLGHGTFVAGVIAGCSDVCPGLAPDAELYIFRVFTGSQISYTSWYLDAFNYAIIKKIHVLNLSIGGPDFLDHPFLDKVWEMSANNMIMVSSIGNDGPIAGSLNNPADMIDVIGVGAIVFNDKLAPFSSRGMTNWELPYGYGRVKPDILTNGFVYGTGINGGCRSLSGTSVASPVVTGAVALLLSAIFKYYNDTRQTNLKLHNVALIKQLLMAGASRLPSISMFDQGHGKMDLLKSYQLLQAYAFSSFNGHNSSSYDNFDDTNDDKSNAQNVKNVTISQKISDNIENNSKKIINIIESTHIRNLKTLDKIYKIRYGRLIPSLSPPYLDTAGASECPYMWPFCSQPIYLTAQPLIVNITILNPVASASTLVDKPTWHPYSRENGKYLHINVAHSSPVLWPWSGWIAIRVTVNQLTAPPLWEGVACGQINLTLRHIGADIDTVSSTSTVIFPLRIRIVRKPPRDKRLLWDQFHNLNYPPGYLPRDNLLHKEEPMDWNGDHLHTNYRGFYNHVRRQGYYVEVLASPITCFDPLDYGALLLVDSEEEFWPGEVHKLRGDVENAGLSLIVIGEWYNTTVMKRVKFYDENTRHWWIPDTGGANVPALNELLSPWNISLGDQVYEGQFSIAKHIVHFSSGTSITNFPSHNSYLFTPNLKDQGYSVINEGSKQNSLKFIVKTVPVLGLYQTLNNEKDTNTKGKIKPGRIVVYGDSNCLDSLRMTKDCFGLLDDLLTYATQGVLSPELIANADNYTFDVPVVFPTRLPGNKLHRYSKVLASVGSFTPTLENQKLAFPHPDKNLVSTPHPDDSDKANTYHSKKLTNDKKINNAMTANKNYNEEKRNTDIIKKDKDKNVTIDNDDVGLHMNILKNVNDNIIHNNGSQETIPLNLKPLPSCQENSKRLSFFSPALGRPLDLKFSQQLSHLRGPFATFLAERGDKKGVDSTILKEVKDTINIALQMKNLAQTTPVSIRDISSIPPLIRDYAPNNYGEESLLDTNHSIGIIYYLLSYLRISPTFPFVPVKSLCLLGIFLFLVTLVKFYRSYVKINRNHDADKSGRKRFHKKTSILPNCFKNLYPTLRQKFQKFVEGDAVNQRVASNEKACINKKGRRKK
ncbi:unnamed protein product [Gordionus sp. m RMFG-2023]|uniref:membrane-bound transcription factor site-1 protease-like n=1 Tax=Gordionus sp. m RMFG-2023 TaxID=3053472 RepID=UPI0030E38EEE